MNSQAALTPEQLARELANAPEAPGPKPDRGGAKGKAKGGGDGPPRGTILLPTGRAASDCPVVPLGVRGPHAYFLDANGQLRAFSKLGIQELQSLFAGRMGALCANWPKFRKGDDGPEPVRAQFEQQTASISLWDACGRLGVFNPANAVRGVGAWADDDGRLVYHLGNKVLHQGAVHAPGRIGDLIYPAAPTIPAPMFDGPDPVPPLIETIESWNWALPDLHPFAVLGIIGAQMLGGALRWRPAVWLTASQGAGKSSFQDLLKLLHGDGLIQSADATKAGITSQLGQSSLPVALDEFEPEDERSRKVDDIITLARIAASGGEWARGSSDQSAVGGKMFSTFFFSSILIPGAMKTQDVQRLIRLDLQPLQTGKGLSLDPRTWRARGARLKGLLINRFDSLAERVARYRHALEVEGVKGRAADNWEIVLAMADLASAEALPDDATCAAWARKVALLTLADAADVQNDADAMLGHLLGQSLDPFRRGEQYTVAQWLMVAAGLPSAPAGLCGDFSSDPMGQEARQQKANDLLAQYGLRIYREAEPVLFIANRGPARQAQLFEGTQWRAGAWSQSARRVPKAYVTTTTKTLAGSRTRGVMVPLQSIPALQAFPESKTGEARTDRGPRDELEDFH